MIFYFIRLNEKDNKYMNIPESVMKRNHKIPMHEKKMSWKFRLIKAEARNICKKSSHWKHNKSYIHGSDTYKNSYDTYQYIKSLV